MCIYIGKTGTVKNPVLLGSRRPHLRHASTSGQPVKVKLDVSCKHCQSPERVVKYGTEYGTQYYWCKDCKRKFADNKAIPKMKVSAARVMIVEGVKK